MPGSTVNGFSFASRQPYAPLPSLRFDSGGGLVTASGRAVCFGCRECNCAIGQNQNQMSALKIDPSFIDIPVIFPNRSVDDTGWHLLQQMPPNFPIFEEMPGQIEIELMPDEIEIEPMLEEIGLSNKKS